MEIGEKIKKLRTEKKLSQKDLALKIGVTQQNVAYFESKGNTITIENAFKIATALEVSIKSLLFDDIDYTDVPNSKEVENLLIAKDKEIADLNSKIFVRDKDIEILTLKNDNLTLKNDSFKSVIEFQNSFIESVRDIGLEQTEDKFSNMFVGSASELFAKLKPMPTKKVDKADPFYEFDTKSKKPTKI